ncbi:DUF4439 domain-containing protein [Cellulomonas bogoriensis]|uniref:DUF4439 domain-containing protein n=1 Tax=Cellulomonas bogoriensis 69B4 = DSM 16987 TaxID=1386082 RepID=A0A0A0C1X4_9CELL|nr:DUF4439 domain-containing protein [Cellulomonas bogoriensis]KGM14165.1 hypothetical protein N869_03375 [Cellulomonas bogoriensis 69B4 = DSM 16987]
MVALATALVLAGCGVRLETPPPAPLVPDDAEVVRQRTTADALALAVLAEHVDTGDDTALADAARAAASASRLHLEALGGIYDPGTEPYDVDGADEPEDSTTTPPAVPRPPQDLQTLLARAAQTALDDADAVPDGPLARLVASVAVSRALHLESMTRAMGPDQDTSPAPPRPGRQDAGTDAGEDDGSDRPPPGVSAADLRSLVLSEDAAGYAWEVVAARAGGDPRTAAAARAAEHRTRADHWARLGGVAKTQADPRRNLYSLPEEIVRPEQDEDLTTALAEVEAALTRAYATLVARADPGERAPVLEGLLETSRTLTEVLAQVPALPGITTTDT